MLLDQPLREEIFSHGQGWEEVRARYEVDVEGWGSLLDLPGSSTSRRSADARALQAALDPDPALERT